MQDGHIEQTTDAGGACMLHVDPVLSTLLMCISDGSEISCIRSCLCLCLQDAVSGDASAVSNGCGRWLLEALVEGGACYLWEPSSGRVFSDPPEGQWPRPVGR